MERQIQDVSDMELKATAYDTLAQIQMLQNQLNTINQELSRRAQAAQQPPPQPITRAMGEPEPQTAAPLPVIPRTSVVPPG